MYAKKFERQALGTSKKIHTKKMKSLRNVTHEYYLNGADSCFENSKNHFETASILETHGLIGFAFSHLIYASEESVKSIALLYLYLDTPFDDETLTDLFSKHKTKHFGAQIFTSILKNISIFKELFNNLTENKISETNLEYEVKSIFLDALKKNPKNKELKKLYDFWTNAENYRLQGQYVSPAGKSWWNPNRFKAHTYKIHLEIVKQLLEFNMNQIQFMKDPANKSFIENSRRNSKIEKEKLEALIESNRKMIENITKFGLKK